MPEGLRKDETSIRLSATYKEWLVVLAKQWKTSQQGVIDGALVALLRHPELGVKQSRGGGNSSPFTVRFNAAGQAILGSLVLRFPTQDSSQSAEVSPPQQSDDKDDWGRVIRMAIHLVWTNASMAQRYLPPADWTEAVLEEMTLHLSDVPVRSDLKAPGRPLTDRLLNRLVGDPGVFDMSQFAFRTDQRTTYCLGGLILDESGVRMEYDDYGRAIGLARGEKAPEPLWINYELSLLVGDVPARWVLPQAKMREIWAAEHGEYAGRILPLYAEDWEPYDRITVPLVLVYIEAIKRRLHLQPAA